jgi:hypothetical protein
MRKSFSLLGGLVGGCVAIALSMSAWSACVRDRNAPLLLQRIVFPGAILAWGVFGDGVTDHELARRAFVFMMILNSTCGAAVGASVACVLRKLWSSGQQRLQQQSDTSGNDLNVPS